MKPAPLLACALALSATAPVKADPQPLPEASFKALADSSPFTRIIDLEGQLGLTGMAWIDGHPVATVIDRRTGKSLLLSETPNAQGWRLVTVTPQGDSGKLVARMAVAGGETLTLHLDPKQLKPRLGKRGITVEITRGKASEYRQGDERRRYYEEMNKRHKLLNEEQRGRVKKIMEEKYRSNPNLTPRDKGTLYLRVMDHVIKESR